MGDGQAVGRSGMRRYAGWRARTSLSFYTVPSSRAFARLDRARDASASMSTSGVHAAVQALRGQNAEHEGDECTSCGSRPPAAWGPAPAAGRRRSRGAVPANMRTEVQNDWATLPRPTAVHWAVGTHLSRLAGAPGSSLAARRLCLVVAPPRARAAQATALVDRALALAADAASGASAGLSGVTLALEMQRRSRRRPAML